MNVTQTQADVVPCQNPDCTGWVEPELDGDHQYYECEDCGFAFGYSRISEQTDNCAIGVPEEVRRQHMSQPGDTSVALPMPILRRSEEA